MQPGDLVDERFELEDIAGEGGMGVVFRARDRATGDRVAVKVLLPSALDVADRFAREVRVLAQLRHPGIVRYLADGASPAGEPWFAMEWLDGESLHARLARAGLTPHESVNLARRIAEALGAAHERGVVHRDVKPSNIMLLGGDLERVKVLDFGIARVGGGGAQSHVATRTGIMIGTPGYMAPEQVRGDKDVGARADVFAVGCVLFECLTGRQVYSGDHVMAVLAKIVLEDAPRVRDVRADVAEALDVLVARTLDRRPDARPRDGAALAAELATVESGDGASRAPAFSGGSSLTATERRLLCVVLIGAPPAKSVHDMPTVSGLPPRTITLELAADTVGSLGDTARAHGGHFERLADGSYVVTLAGSGGASDQVVQAARCAMALRATFDGAASAPRSVDARAATDVGDLDEPAPPIALATGRGVMAGRWPVGEAIDRAVPLLAAPTSHVRIDEVTAGLLDARFEVGGDDHGLYIAGERDIVEVTRTLLGKPTPCVGRDRELAQLSGLVDECFAEPVARAVLLTGAQGVGKSRVRFELVNLIRARLGRGDGIEVWFGRGDALRAGSPYAMIAPALRRAAGIHDNEPLDVRRQKLRARVARHAATPDVVRRTTLFLGEMVGIPFADHDPVLSSARADPLLMADQVRRGFEQFLAIETAAQPVVIVLEDLQWGDLPTTKLVEAALRALPDRPWFVLAVARPEVHEVFARLWSDARGAHEMRLDELTRKGADKLVRGVLGADASPTLVARILDQASGNPFYLEELVRAVAEGKGDALPETVLAVVQSRLERLEGDARRVLRAAAVFGQPFWRGGVTALLGGEAREDTARAWLDELLARELVSRAQAPRFPDEDEFLFRSSLVREAAYAMLTDADRKLGHALAGGWLERVGEGDAMVLAEHFERGGERERAMHYYRRAAARALAACDFAAAIARADRGVACGAADEDLGALRLLQAEALKWSGAFAEAARRGREAMALLPPGSAGWYDAAAEAAEAIGRSGDTNALVSVGEALLAAPEDVRSVTATAHSGFQLFYSGHLELAHALLDRVERVAGAVTDPAILARVYQARSSRASFTGDAGAYLESEQAAAELFERAGDLRNACMQRGHVGYACLEIGAYAEAEQWLRDALAGGEQMGLSSVVATAKHNLGRALWHQGRLDEALRVEQEAFDAFAAQGDRRLEPAARVYTAYILSDLGDLAAAEVELRAALAAVTRLMRPPVLAALARVVLATGRRFEALAMAQEAAEALDELGAIEEGESLIRLMLAETLAATGDLPAALAAAARARDRLLERAARISDPAWRDSFLVRVAENARTLDLAADLEAR
nr:protein kinase [Kofleriaceae bacterium]